METIEQALEAIRTVESNQNYAYQQKVRVGGEIATKVGAYGIIDKRWEQLTQAGGYAGADWRDPTAQDTIARQKLQRDYDELGSWEMAVIAFRFGSRAARQLQKAGYIEPKAIEDAGYKNIGQYFRDIQTKTVNERRRVDGQLEAAPEVETRGTTPKRKRSDDIVRNHLRAMLNAQNRAAPAPEEEAPEQAEEMPV